MNKKLKFRAWIPELKLMLYGFALYPDGMIGIGSEDFEEQLKKVNPGFYIDWNDNCIRLKRSGQATDEHILNILTGEDWIWLEDVVDIMQYIYQSEGKKDVYEKDYVFDISMQKNILIQDDFTIAAYKNIDSYQINEPIGNIFQNPELLEEK